jgi:Ca2+-binding RTX toxin-like protein
MSARRALLAALAAGAITASLAATAAPTSAGTPAAGATPRAMAAPPGSDATIQTNTFTVAAATVGDATVTCPAGKRVVGGGFAPVDPKSHGHVQQSGPVDATGRPETTETGDVARSWLVSVQNTSAEAAEFRVFAICSATSDATIVAGAVTKDPNEAYAQGVATCPAGTRAVGGGMGATGPTLPLFFNASLSAPVNDSGQLESTVSGDVARSWVVSVDARTPYRVFALCSAGSDATIATKAFSVEDDSVVPVGATVQCPAGKRVLGGGIGVTGPGLSWTELNGPLDETGETAKTESGDVARSWTASVSNIADITRVFRVSAICAADAAPTTPAGSRARCAGLKATIAGTAGPDRLVGTPGPDVIAGLGGNDTISGLGGNDIVCGGGGNDTIAGGPGNDRLYGELGNDNLNGGPGNDLLVGGPGVDRITGGPGSNVVKP